MLSVDRAVLCTILYADVFAFPLNLDEIAHFLIHPVPLPRELIAQRLMQSPFLRERLYMQDGYYAICERSDIVALRQAREQIAEGMMAEAVRYGRWLAHIPFVRMVALTGALAMRNPAHPRDDYDFFLITAPRRVWLARLCAVVLVRLARLRGVHLCPNYLLAQDDLAQARRDLYMAHEVVQMIPLYGREYYERMLAENDWTQDFMPNAQQRTQAYLSEVDGRLKAWLERMLAGRLGDGLERWEQRRKQRRLTRLLSHESDARLDSSSVKGHFVDHGQRVLAAYRERLQRYGLEDWQT
ncbi:MAG: hypothetical protein NZ750_03980 [Anaerolineae bacterium]|nr:hypothetical protein [Anaerolineae bacterium]MDW8171481.1 hypothetical protein [Anaerolineae bacterium]